MPPATCSRPCHLEHGSGVVGRLWQPHTSGCPAKAAARRFALICFPAQPGPRCPPTMPHWCTVRVEERGVTEYDATADVADRPQAWSTATTVVGGRAVLATTAPRVCMNKAVGTTPRPAMSRRTVVARRSPCSAAATPAATGPYPRTSEPAVHAASNHERLRRHVCSV